MQKIMIIGSPGAGKSTFARKLRDVTDIPLYYLDQMWHRPDRTTVTREAFDRRLAEVIRQDRWIIDGNYQRTLEVRLRACDTVFLLDYPLQTCLAGAQSRIGKPREDLPWIEEEFDGEFREWIVNFPKIQLPQIYQFVEKYRANRDVIIFRTRKEADDYLRALSVRQ